VEKTVIPVSMWRRPMTCEGRVKSARVMLNVYRVAVNAAGRAAGRVCMMSCVEWLAVRPQASVALMIS